MKDRYLHIEAYIMNTLSLDDRKVFEQQLKSDPELRHDLEQHIKMKRSLDYLLEEDLRSYIHTLKTDAPVNNINTPSESTPFKKNTYKKLQRSWVGIAAALLVLIAASYWLWDGNQKQSDVLAWNEKVYKEYYQPTVPRSDLDRSGEGQIVSDETQLFLKAMDLADSNKHGEALEIYLQLTQSTNAEMQQNAFWNALLIRILLKDAIEWEGDLTKLCDSELTYSELACEIVSRLP